MNSNFRAFVTKELLGELRVVEGQVNQYYDAHIFMLRSLSLINNGRYTFTLTLEPCEFGFGDFEEWLDAYGITVFDLSITDYRFDNKSGCLPKHIMEGDLRSRPKPDKDAPYWKRFVAQELNSPFPIFIQGGEERHLK